MTELQSEHRNCSAEHPISNELKGVPITIYGLSSLPPNVTKLSDQPRLASMDIVIHHGSQTFKFEASTGLQMPHFNQKFRSAVGNRLADNYRLMTFHAVSYDQFLDKIRAGTFLPHCREIHTYLVPTHYHSEPLPNPLEVQLYKGSLSRDSFYTILVRSRSQL